MVFKIAYIGYLSNIKGLNQLYQIMIKLQTDDVEFYLFGGNDRYEYTLPFKVIKSYNDIHDISNFIDEYEIDCAILPSICDETYSYVLSECWKCGLPVIGSKFGAIGERIATHCGGWVIDPYNINDVVDLIRTLSKNPILIMIYKEQVKCIKLKSLNTMIDEYTKLYEEF